MNRKIKMLLLGVIVGVSTFAINVGGVELKDKVTLKSKELVLNGAGIRKKFFLKLYVASLYTSNKEEGAKEILESQGEMQIKLDITSSMITGKRLREGLEEGFATASPEKLKPIQDKIDKFIVKIEKEEIKKGDVFTFNYVDGKVNSYKNEKLIITTDGKEFKEVLFGIWLGEHAVDKDLKEEMVGVRN